MVSLLCEGEAGPVCSDVEGQALVHKFHFYVIYLLVPPLHLSIYFSIAHAALQDGLLALCALPGQVLQHPSGTFLVLGQHKWSVLVWPASTSDPSLGGNLLVWLNARASAQCLHVWQLRDLFTFASASVSWEGQDGVVVICREKEPLLKNSLRQSSVFTFNDLVVLADHHNYDKPRNATRNELLKFLAGTASEGNEDYITMVLNSDGKCSKKASEAHDDEEQEAQDDDEILEMILENMDGAEKGEFEEIHLFHEHFSRVMVMLKECFVFLICCESSARASARAHARASARGRARASAGRSSQPPAASARSLAK